MGYASDEMANALELAGLRYDAESFNIWRRLCVLKSLKFTPDKLHADETAVEIITRIADAGHVVLILTVGQPVKIYIDAELIKEFEL